MNGDGPHNLSPLDGWTATEAIRQHCVQENCLQNPLIIALSAHATEANREHSVARGMDDYLTKPLRISALTALFDKYGLRRIAPDKQNPESHADPAPQRPCAYLDGSA
jgi:CheY-like chemotaxis protein